MTEPTAAIASIRFGRIAPQLIRVVDVCLCADPIKKADLFLFLVLVKLSSVAYGADLKHPTEGFRITVPARWFVNEHLIAVGGPLSVTSFPPAQWVHGGLLPPDGIEIIVRRADAPNANAALDALEIGGQRPARINRVLGHRQTVGRSSEFRHSEYAEHLYNVAFEVDGKVFLAHLRERISDGETVAANTIFAEVVSSVVLVKEAESARP